MRKRQALCIASVASNLDNFNQNNVEILLKLGYEVTLAANFHTKEETNSQEKINGFAKDMRAKGVHIVHVDFSRRIRKIGQQMKSIIQVKRLLKRKFDLIHCHSPTCAAIVRAEAEKYRKACGTKVFYTAHGFHFFKGSPLKNWLLFYPAEKLMSRYTDVLITINEEDYRRAQEKFYAKKTVYIPGVGVDTKKFCGKSINRENKRRELGLKESELMLLSVGELNANKNHELTIKALSILKKEEPDIFEQTQYFICGKGELKNYLEKLVRSLGLEKHIHFLGYRSDAVSIYTAADVFIFTSKREGLPMALMEAMAAGLPVICTNVRGNTDLVRHGKEGYVTSYKAIEVKEFLCELLENSENRVQLGRNSRKRVKSFDKKNVIERMKILYCSI